jgi:hypothetical protein
LKLYKHMYYIYIMEDFNAFTAVAISYMMNIIHPYKHNTIESVEQDPDIENQLEKVSKQSVVVVGNIFVKLLLLKVETIKWISLRVKAYIDIIMDKETSIKEEDAEEKEEPEETNEENNFEIIDKKNQ